MYVIPWSGTIVIEALHRNAGGLVHDAQIVLLCPVSILRIQIRSRVKGPPILLIRGLAVIGEGKGFQSLQNRSVIVPVDTQPCGLTDCQSLSDSLIAVLKYSRSIDYRLGSGPYKSIFLTVKIEAGNQTFFDGFCLPRGQRGYWYPGHGYSCCQNGCEHSAAY